MKYKLDVEKRKLVDYEQELTDAQKEYFSNTALKDRDGDLIVCRHYTDAKFDTFDLSYLGSSQGDSGYCGEGIYFTSMNTFGTTFGQNCYECFIDMKKPLIVDEMDNYDKYDLFDYLASSDDYKKGYLPRLEGHPTQEEDRQKSILIDILEYHEFRDEELKDNIAALLDSYDYSEFKREEDITRIVDSNEFYMMKKSEEFMEVIEERGLEDYLELKPLCIYDLTGDNLHRGHWVDFAGAITEWAKRNGYDGIVSESIPRSGEVREIVVFEPNQIKSINNLYPTKDDNFLDNAKEYLQENRKYLSNREIKEIEDYIGIDRDERAR